MVTERPAEGPQGWTGAYFGNTGGPEWLNEPVHPLQDRRRTQGSQSCKHDEGQHLPRKKETEYLVKWPRTTRSRPWGRAEAGPNSWSSSPNLSTNSHSHPCQCLVTPTMPTILDCPEENQIRGGTRCVCGVGQGGAVLKLRYTNWARQVLFMGEGARWELGRSKESTLETAATKLHSIVARWECGPDLTVFKRNPDFHVKSLNF